LDTERVGCDTREDTKEGAVRETGDAGDEEEVVWVRDYEGEQLGQGEEGRGGGQAPDAGGVEAFDEDVGADAGSETAEGGTDAEDADVHLFTTADEGAGFGGVVGAPEGGGVVADVAAMIVSLV